MRFCFCTPSARSTLGARALATFGAVSVASAALPAVAIFFASIPFGSAAFSSAATRISAASRARAVAVSSSARARARASRASLSSACACAALAADASIAGILAIEPVVIPGFPDPETLSPLLAKDLLSPLMVPPALISAAKRWLSASAWRRISTALSRSSSARRRASSAARITASSSATEAGLSVLICGICDGDRNFGICTPSAARALVAPPSGIPAVAMSTAMRTAARPQQT